MNNSSPLTLTIMLSLATVLGYGAYRLLYTPESGVQPAGQSHIGHDGAATHEESLPDSLPNFSLANLDGGTTSIDSWLGRPMVINFWATWCAPCLREIPLLMQFQTDEPGVQVIGIAVDRVAPVREFAADMEFNYPILMGQAEAMDAATAFGVDVFVMPFTVFTTADGATLGYHAGELHEEHLADLTATLAEFKAGELNLSDARARIAGLR